LRKSIIGVLTRCKCWERRRIWRSEEL